MIKDAGKPSMDPVQEKLRQHKKVFNKRTSEFISNLINLKKLMNGWENSFYKDKSKIGEPIPADPATILGALASDFQEIAEEGKLIIDEQLNYSKVRRRPSAKQLDLPFQASANQSNNELISEGSNALSRFLSRLRNPTFSIPFTDKSKTISRSFRMSLLTSATDCYKDLNRLDALVLGSDPKSVFMALELASKIRKDWEFLISNFNEYLNIIGHKEDFSETEKKPSKAPKEDKSEEKSEPKAKKEVKKKEEVKEDPKDETPKELTVAQKALAMQKDYKKNFRKADYLYSVCDKLFVELATENENLEMSKNNKREADAAISFMKIYLEILAKFSEYLGVEINSFSEIPAKKTAQELVSRYLGKLRHSLPFGDKTSSMRKAISLKIAQAKDIIDNIMNSLESDMDLDLLKKKTTNVHQLLASIRSSISALHSPSKHKDYSDTYINMMKNHMVDDYNIDMNAKQEKYMKSILDQKRLRDLTKTYLR